MENTGNEPKEQSGFLQGSGFIMLIIIIVVGVLIGLKYIVG